MNSTIRERMRMFPLQSARGTCRQRQFTCVRIGQFNITRYKRSVRSMLYLYAAFAFCYLPPFCVLVVMQVRGTDRTTHIVRFLGSTLILMNSSLNPLLYCWRIREIRRMVRRTIRNVFCKWKPTSSEFKFTVTATEYLREEGHSTLNVL